MTARDKKGKGDDRQGVLLDMGSPRRVDPELRKPRHRIWTENKAVLIQRYLQYFVYVTRCGSYVDCFTGPQDPEKLETWAAKLVVESEPRWLQHIVLFEHDVAKIPIIEEMVASQPPRNKSKKEPKRRIEVRQGDCNVLIRELLSSGRLNTKQATFCLLDQHTFECEWETARLIASHPMKQYKIEQFYFLGSSWLDRSIAASTTAGGKAKIARWWGSDEWSAVRSMTGLERATVFSERFKTDLKYVSAKPWPIYDRADGGHVMYYMIHATDHPVAPGLMRRAYEKAVLPPETMEQLDLALAQYTGRPSSDATPRDE